MNYAALKCALHNDNYDDFMIHLKKVNRFSPEEDEIFAHAAFFGKLRYVKALLSSNKMFDEIRSCQNTISICLRRKNYNTFCVVMNRLLENFPYCKFLLFRYFNKYPDDYTSIEYLYNSPFKNVIGLSELCERELYNFVRDLIVKVLTFLNNRDKNIYLIMEIVMTHPIAKEFTNYQIVKMII
jgi:hypothetical protein